MVYTYQITEKLLFISVKKIPLWSAQSIHTLVFEIEITHLIKKANEKALLKTGKRPTRPE